MKKLFAILFFLISLSSFASILEIEYETRSAEATCNNARELTFLLSPYVDVNLLECSSRLIKTGWLGTKTYSVYIRFQSNVKPCRSSQNQAIIFDLPTNEYIFWNPPTRFAYIDRILKVLDFKSEIAIRNIGPSHVVPSYKQIVFIPECAFK